MRQDIAPAGRSIIGVELLMGSNSKPKTHREIADVILMCEAMKTTDFQIKNDAKQREKRRRRKTVNFDENLEQLDEIVERLEEGKVSLNETLSLFERGVVLVRESQKFLEEAEQKVTLLTRDDEEVPFVHQGRV
jgi:exodeoxyribonuclease VII small subunit